MNTSRLSALLLVTILFPVAARAVTIDTIPVGNPGNTGEAQPDLAVTIGSVPYEYHIGTFEVTNVQYVEFLNAVDPTGSNRLEFYNSRMSSDPVGGIDFNRGATIGARYEVKPGRDNNPVNFVSWYDAVRFANWLHNGEGNGDTETGAYTLLGGTPIPANGPRIARNSGATWFLPDDDEWYKAAYHKNDGATDNYWAYPTGSDTAPSAGAPPGRPNSVNAELAVGTVTDVGAYSHSDSPYGTFDQAGNVMEWTETLVIIENDPGLDPFLFRRLRGGSWPGADFDSASRFWRSEPGDIESGFAGFRVASIPEPTSMLLAAVAALGVFVPRRLLR